MGRPPLDNKKQRQLAVALPPDVRLQLEAAASASGRSLAEEIRRRVNLTLYDDAEYDAPTRELAEDIKWIAAEISRQTGWPWHVLPRGRESLAIALQTWLEITAPKRETSVGASDLFVDDPATLGRSIARWRERHKIELAKSENEMRELQKGKRP